jgi:hypothetical protein
MGVSFEGGMGTKRESEEEINMIEVLYKHV